MSDSLKTALEIKQKFLFDEPNALKKALEKDGFASFEPWEEMDIYFSDEQGQFIQDRIGLRFRLKYGEPDFEVDFKGKMNSALGRFMKTEDRLRFPKEQMRALEALFSYMGFYRYVRMIKARCFYEKQNEGIIEKVTLDTIEDVGRFLEIEVTAAHDQVPLSDLKKQLDKRIHALSCGALRPADVLDRDFSAWLYRKALRDGLFDVWVVDLDSVFGFSEGVKNILAGPSITDQDQKSDMMASVKALQKASEVYGVLLISDMPREALQAWLKRVGIDEENYFLFKSDEPIDRLLDGKKALGLLGKDGDKAYFQEKEIPFVTLGSGPFQHLMQIHLLLTCAERCEVF